MSTNTGWERMQLEAILKHWGLPDHIIEDDGDGSDFSIHMTVDFRCGDEREGFVTVFIEHPEGDCGEYDIPLSKFLGN